MWWMTKDGFYSIVDKGGRRSQLCIRARDGEDLDRLRSSYLPKLGPTITDQGTDYPFRAYATRAQVARAASEAVKDIHYGNFKNEVRRVRGDKHEGVFHRVWDALLSLEPRGAWKPGGYGYGSLWDNDPFWDEQEPKESFLETADTMDCRRCHESVPLFVGEDVSDPETRERIAAEIEHECEFNDTGSHFGQTVEEALAA